MIYINLAVEDDLSEIVLRKLLSLFKEKYEIQNCYCRNGFGYLKSSIKGFNQASVVTPYIVLTDLDKYECPCALIADWIKFPVNHNLIFRIAIREVESWLLADSKGLADFFNISEAHLPREPEEVLDPKELLINLARKSNKRRIKDGLVPLNKFASIGPNYNGRLSEFVVNYWNVMMAIRNSSSLKRAYNKLNSFVHSN